MTSTRIRQHINAPRAAVYRALLDAAAVATWMVPSGMTSQVHAFEPREGGAFRISLTYDTATGAGKTTAHSDTYHGRFVTLVPNERVVEVVEFETADPALRGEISRGLVIPSVARAERRRRRGIALVPAEGLSVGTMAIPRLRRCAAPLGMTRPADSFVSLPAWRPAG